MVAVHTATTMGEEEKSLHCWAPNNHIALSVHPAGFLL